MIFLMILNLCFSYCFSYTLNNKIRTTFSIVRSSKTKQISHPVTEEDNSIVDKISTKQFHHVEFYCGDSLTSYKRFLLGLGAELIAKSDQSTGNMLYSSFVLQSGQVKLVFTAPYGNQEIKIDDNNNYNTSFAEKFILKHGFGVRAIAIEVDDVEKTYDVILANNGVSVLSPRRIHDLNNKGYYDIAEIQLYGDVVLRLLSLTNFVGNFLPNYDDVNDQNGRNRALELFSFVKKEKLGFSKGLFGIKAFDHIVGNLWSLQPTQQYIQNITGFHEFAEFVADDVGTVDSGLNSVVLANNKENILLPLNEPTFGTKRKSQIQTYLEQNQGEGVQHIALQSSDIFYTLECMKSLSDFGGFEFMDSPGPTYYENVRKRLGDNLSEIQYELIEKYGILADMDKEGILLQIFTKPIGDRPTIFLEVIQRIGCIDKETLDQKPGCGGFGKGNFKDLFKSIEDYEKKLGI